MPEDLNALREQKRELLFESEINRQILQLEFGQLNAKAAEWRRGLLKTGAIYKWAAPLAGLGLGFLTARKRAKRQHQHNGSGDGKLAYLGLLAPLGMSMLKQGLALWREARKQSRKSGHL